MKPTPLEIDVLRARRIAAEASVDERTLVKVLRGDRVRGMPYVRARQALEAAGFDVPLPVAPRRKGVRP
jgi:uncharacterized protein YbjT (DUF2867 family)